MAEEYSTNTAPLGSLIHPALTQKFPLSEFVPSSSEPLADYSACNGGTRYQQHNLSDVVGIKFKVCYFYFINAKNQRK